MAKVKNTETPSSKKEVNTVKFNGTQNKWLLPCVKVGDYVLKKYAREEVVKRLAHNLYGLFLRNEELKGKLLGTSGDIVYAKKGHPLGKKNTLGLVLMSVRKRIKDEGDIERCPNAVKHKGENGCYSGTYWVRDYVTGKMRNLGPCYKCLQGRTKGKGGMTTQGHIREDGKEVWSDKERNKRYQEKKEGQKVLSPEDIDKEIEKALDEDEFTVS